MTYEEAHEAEVSKRLSLNQTESQIEAAADEIDAIAKKASAPAVATPERKLPATTPAEAIAQRRPTWAETGKEIVGAAGRGLNWAMDKSGIGAAVEGLNSQMFPAMRDLQATLGEDPDRFTKNSPNARIMGEALPGAALTVGPGGPVMLAERAIAQGLARAAPALGRATARGLTTVPVAGAVGAGLPMMAGRTPTADDVFGAGMGQAGGEAAGAGISKLAAPVVAMAKRGAAKMDPWLRQYYESQASGLGDRVSVEASQGVAKTGRAGIHEAKARALNTIEGRRAQMRAEEQAIYREGEARDLQGDYVRPDPDLHTELDESVKTSDASGLPWDPSLDAEVKRLKATQTGTVGVSPGRSVRQRDFETPVRGVDEARLYRNDVPGERIDYLEHPGPQPVYAPDPTNPRRGKVPAGSAVPPPLRRVQVIPAKAEPVIKVDRTGFEPDAPGLSEPTPQEVAHFMETLKAEDPGLRAQLLDNPEAAAKALKAWRAGDEEIGQAVNYTQGPASSNKDLLQMRRTYKRRAYAPGPATADKMLAGDVYQVADKRVKARVPGAKERDERFSKYRQQDKRAEDIIYRTQDDAGKAADLPQPEVADDLAVTLEDLAEVQRPSTAIKGRTSLGRLGDESEEGLRLQPFLEELAAMDPAFREAMEQLAAKKAHEATRFSMMPAIQGNLDAGVMNTLGIPWRLAQQNSRAGIRKGVDALEGVADGAARGGGRLGLNLGLAESLNERRKQQQKGKR